MADNQKNNRKSKHTGAKVVGGAALLALLFGGGYFGLGIGNSGGGVIGGHETEAGSAGSPEETKQQETPAATEPSTEETQESTEETKEAIRISVKESEIWYNDTKVTLEELKAALLHDYSFTQKQTVTLTDEKAVKGTYDEVVTLLQTLKIEFTQ